MTLAPQDKTRLVILGLVLSFVAGIFMPVLRDRLSMERQSGETIAQAATLRKDVDTLAAKVDRTRPASEMLSKDEFFQYQKAIDQRLARIENIVDETNRIVRARR